MNIEEREKQGLPEEQLATLEIAGGDPPSEWNDDVVLISGAETKPPSAMATSEMMGEDYVYLTQTCHFGKELSQMVMKSLPDWEEKFEAILDGDEDAEHEYHGYFLYPLKYVCNINLDRFPVFKMSQKYDF